MLRPLALIKNMHQQDRKRWDDVRAFLDLSGVGHNGDVKEIRDISGRVGLDVTVVDPKTFEPGKTIRIVWYNDNLIAATDRLPNCKFRHWILGDGPFSIGYNT